MNLLMIKQVCVKVGFKTSTIYKWMAEDKSPKPRKYGFASRWFESDIDYWIENSRTDSNGTH